jgi:hypothetical protein
MSKYTPIGRGAIFRRELRAFGFLAVFQQYFLLLVDHF